MPINRFIDKLKFLRRQTVQILFIIENIKIKIQKVESNSLDIVKRNAKYEERKNFY